MGIFTDEENRLSALRASGLFDGIGDDDLSGALECLGARFVEYGRGEFVFAEGDPATRVGIVCRGEVRVIRGDAFGNRTVMTVVEAGGIFGESLACARVDSMPVAVEATRESEIMLIDYRRIVSTCGHSCPFHPMMIENMLGILARKNLMLNGKIEALSARGTRAKLLAYLSGEARRAGSRRFRIPLDRQGLADYLAVDRSAMSAELGRMRGDGLIDFDRNEFELREATKCT